MNTIMIALLVFLIMLLLFLIFNKYIEDETKYLKVVGIVVGISAAIGLILDIASFKSDYKHELEATERIVALNDNNGLDGKFYMRRGYIESNLYYNYMVDLSNGGYIANKVPANKTTVFETDGKYRIEWWIKKKGYLFSVRQEKYWKAYIPKNSIVSEYEIDLK